MLLYRLSEDQYIRDLSGEGARLYGGRWNKKGTAMLYTSVHCSLALLELIIHTPHNLLPEETSLLKISVPDSLSFKTIGGKNYPQTGVNSLHPILLLKLAQNGLARMILLG